MAIIQKVVSLFFEAIVGDLITDYFDKTSKRLNVRSLIERTSVAMTLNLDLSDETISQLEQLFSPENAEVLTYTVLESEAKNLLSALAHRVEKLIIDNQPQEKYREDLSGFCSKFIETVIGGIEKFDQPYANRILLSKLDLEMKKDREEINDIIDVLQHRLYKSDKEHCEEINELKNAINSLEDPYAYLIEKNIAFSDDYYSENVFKYWYRNNANNFIGRKFEISQLEDFCEDSRTILWWAITGDGGIGKSHLAYEFIRRRKTDEQWAMLFLDWEQIAADSHIQTSPCNYYKNSLIVFDYITGNEEGISNWICRLPNNREKKIRILLLERESIRGEEKILDRNPQWYKKMLSGMSKKNILLSRQYKKEFIELKQLSENDTKELIWKYSNMSGSPCETGYANQEYITDLLYTHLKNIDTNKNRPLYALIITSAWQENPETIKWDSVEIIQYIIDREKENIKSIFRGNVEAYYSYKELLAFACVVNRLELENIPTYLKRSFDVLIKYAHEGDERLLEKLLEIGHTVKYGDTFSIVALVPDILGEYFVLDFLNDKLLDLQHHYLDAFRTCAWEYSPFFVQLFFSKLIQDYFGNPLLSLTYLFSPLEDIDIYFYQEVFTDVSDLTANSECQHIKEIVTMLQTAAEIFEDWDIGYSYAISLYNLSLDVESDDEKSCIKKLRDLAEKYKDNEYWDLYTKRVRILILELDQSEAVIEINKLYEIANRYNHDNLWINYADSLVNLTRLQNITQKKSTINQLMELAEKKDIPRIWIDCGYGLLYLAFRETFKSKEKTVQKLFELAERINDGELWLLYSKGLVEICRYESPVGIESRIESLYELAEKKANEDLWVSYAEGLVLLINKTTGLKVNKTIGKIRILAKKINHKEIWVAYAQGLLIASKKKNKAGATGMIKEIGELDNRLNIEEIRKLYSEGLGMLAYRQENFEALETIEALRENAEKSKDDSHWMIFAAAMLDLSNKQKGADLLGTLTSLLELSRERNDEKIHELFMAGLKRVFKDKSEEENIEMRILFRAFAEKQNEQYIWHVYSNALVKLSSYSKSELLFELADELHRLASKYLDDEIWFNYSQVLYNIVINKSVVLTKDIFYKLRKIAIEHDCEDIWIEYSRALLFLIRFLNEEDMMLVNKELKKIAFRLDSETIWCIYVIGEYNLLKTQNREKAEKSLSKMIEVEKKYENLIMKHFIRRAKMIIDSEL